MRDKLYWVATGLSFLVLALSVTGMVMHGNNRALQEQVSQRGQQITAGQGFAQLYQGLVQSLANDAVQKKDEAIRDMLLAEGITLNQPAAPAAPAAVSGGKK